MSTSAASARQAFGGSPYAAPLQGNGSSPRIVTGRRAGPQTAFSKVYLYNGFRDYACPSQALAQRGGTRGVTGTYKWDRPMRAGSACPGARGWG